MFNTFSIISISYLNTRLQLGAAVCQDAKRQVQDFPRTIWMFDQIQQRSESTSCSESSNAGLVTLDVLCPDRNQGSPLRNSGPFVHFSPTAWVSLVLYMILSCRSSFGEVSQAPGQRSLW